MIRKNPRLIATEWGLHYPGWRIEGGNLDREEGAVFDWSEIEFWTDKPLARGGVFLICRKGYETRSVRQFDSALRQCKLGGFLNLKNGLQTK